MTMTAEPKVHPRLTSHVVNTCNNKITIEVMDEPGPGGANHHYRIAGFNSAGNASDPYVKENGTFAVHSNILFQNGPIAEVGTNGVTHEVFLAILIHRLQCFQNGPYKCRENAIALTHLEDAQMWLQKRTRDRIVRGVEGTMKV